MVTRMGRTFLASACAVAFFGCGGERGLVPPASETFFFLALSAGDGAGDSVIQAILMQSGDPASSRYVSARQFEMFRVADNASFAWRASAATERPKASYRGLQVVSSGNYALSTGDVTGRLGRSGLTPGAEYSLRLTLEDHIIFGKTRIPVRVRPRVTEVAGRRVIRWSPVPGVPLYVVETEFFGATETTDTTYVLSNDTIPGLGTAAQRLRIASLDSNLARYWRDSLVRRSGLSSGLGVFGSYALFDTLLPPRSP